MSEESLLVTTQSHVERLQRELANVLEILEKPMKVKV